MSGKRKRPVVRALCRVALSLVMGAAAADAADRPGAQALASVSITELPPEPIYWHLDTYRTRAAADTARGPRGTVVEAFGQTWLFTLAGADWRAPGGTRVATIGPLRVLDGGVPMQLASIGSEIRRSLVLILHDATQPWKVPAATPWVPDGSCLKSGG